MAENEHGGSVDVVKDIDIVIADCGLAGTWAETLLLGVKGEVERLRTALADNGRR